MAGLEQTIRRWLRESRLEIADFSAPETVFSLAFKYPSGLQLTAVQPAGRPDMVVIACGITIDAEGRAAIQPNAADFMWNVRRDLLLSKLGFQTSPADAPVPETVGVSLELYQDGLNKTVFMRGAQEVHSGAILVLLTTRKYVEAGRAGG